MGCDQPQAASADDSIFPVSQQEPPPRHPDLFNLDPGLALLPPAFQTLDTSPYQRSTDLAQADPPAAWLNT